MNAERARVLVVEDNALIAMELESVLGRAGYDVVGPTPSVSGGLEAVRQGALDAAILDVHIRGGDCRPIARELEASGVPFVLVTGYDESIGIDGAAAHLRKPVSRSGLLEAVADMLKGRAVPEPGTPGSA